VERSTNAIRVRAVECQAELGKINGGRRMVAQEYAFEVSALPTGDARVPSDVPAAADVIDEVLVAKE